MIRTVMDELLVYIGGSGRSGSTLLDLLLGNSSQVQSLGEFHRISWYARTNHEPCTCGASVSECPFWARIEALGRNALEMPSDARPLRTLDPMLSKERVGSFRRFVHSAALTLPSLKLQASTTRVLASPYAEAVANSLFWYEVIRKHTGCPVIVDSTKDVRRLKALFGARPQEFRLIIMVRDGRAVAASSMRRTGVGMAPAAMAWLRANLSTWSVLMNLPRSQRMVVRYEDLATDTHATMGRVARFLGLSLEASMSRLVKSEAHNIGGNPMRFESDRTEIALDERWRQDLSARDRAVFDLVAGLMNRAFGYGY